MIFKIYFNNLISFFFFKKKNINIFNITWWYFGLLIIFVALE